MEPWPSFTARCVAAGPGQGAASGKVAPSCIWPRWPLCLSTDPLSIAARWAVLTTLFSASIRAPPGLHRNCRGGLPTLREPLLRSSTRSSRCPKSVLHFRLVERVGKPLPRRQPLRFTSRATSMTGALGRTGPSSLPSAMAGVGPPHPTPETCDAVPTMVCGAWFPPVDVRHTEGGAFSLPPSMSFIHLPHISSMQLFP